MRLTVLGAGAWGTALARMLALNGHAVTLWDYFAENLAEIERTGRNERFLPGVALPPFHRLEPDLAKAVDGAECLVAAVLSRVFGEVTRQFGGYRGCVISVTKGIDYETGLTMSGLLKVNAPAARVAAMSGPTLALEVARGVPTAIVAASTDAATGRAVQALFHQPAFRVYTSSDVLGVELGGALKNVIAIAAGVSDGLGFGDNSKAALITRAIVEIRRVGVACGAQAETFAGLSGLGDLVVTCVSKLSRNRTLGERLGRGEKLADIVASTASVAEGVPTAQSAYQLARRLGVVTPIIDEVYAMLYGGKNVGQALQDLIGRESKAEN